MTATLRLTCADWCITDVGECGDGCFSDSAERRIECGNDWAHRDERGEEAHYETSVYLQRNAGWGTEDMTDEAITQVRLVVDDIGWCGGTDVGMTVEQARELAAHLLQAADSAEVDRGLLLSAGHHV